MKFERKKRNSGRTLILLLALLVAVVLMMLLLPDAPDVPQTEAVGNEPAPVPTEQVESTGEADGGCEQTEMINE